MATASYASEGVVTHLSVEGEVPLRELGVSADKVRTALAVAVVLNYFRIKDDMGPFPLPLDDRGSMAWVKDGTVGYLLKFQVPDPAKFRVPDTAALRPGRKAGR